jgi:hypothetical protein
MIKYTDIPYLVLLMFTIVLAIVYHNQTGETWHLWPFAACTCVLNYITNTQEERKLKQKMEQDNEYTE